MPDGNTIKELEELFETPFEEALMMANKHQNFDDLINFLEGGIGTQFHTGNVEGMSDTELRRVVTELCKKHRWQEDSFHPETGQIISNECQRRGISLGLDVIEWLDYLKARSMVSAGNNLFNKQMRLRLDLRDSHKNGIARAIELKALIGRLPAKELEDLIQVIAGGDISPAMGKIVSDEVEKRGGCPEGCDEAMKKIYTTLIASVKAEAKSIGRTADASKAEAVTAGYSPTWPD